MALEKQEKKMPVPKQVQKRYKQELNKYRKQIQKSQNIQKNNIQAA